MSRTIPAIIVAVVLLVLLALMWRSWRRRTRRDAGISAGHPLPAAAGNELARATGFYVASTRRGRPLERLHLRGLGFRERAELVVRDDGLAFTLTGGTPVYLPASSIDRFGLATWTIDRVVESDGLLLVGWQAPTRGSSPGQAPPASATTTDASGTVGVDSYFRIVDTGDRSRIIQAIHAIAPAAVEPAGTTESEA